jgi:hypothetical protein
MAASGFGEDWGVLLALWTVGQPILTIAWLSTSGGRPLARVGCFALALVALALLIALMLWAMAIGGMVSGV